jgi:hypothetical protein
MAEPHWAVVLSLGFLAGCATVVEYSNALLAAAVALYLIFTAQPRLHRGWMRSLTLFIAGGFLPAAFLTYYNTVNFGSPVALSYDYAVNYPWAGHFFETFSFPLVRGLRGMLIWGEGGGWCNPTCYNQGLLLLSPVLLLSVLGVGSFIRRARRASILTLGLFLTYLVLFAKHRTFHGFTADGRYLTPFLALWCLPLAFFLDNVRAWSGRPVWRALTHLALYGSFFLSLRNIFLSQLDTIVVRPANWTYLLSQVFPNTRNLPLLWALDAFPVLAALGASWVVSHPPDEP